MILECPECKTRYDLPVELPEGGRKVRCAQCSNIWHATEEHVFTEMEPTPDPEIPEEEESADDIAFDDAVAEEPEAEPADSSEVDFEPDVDSDIDFDDVGDSADAVAEDDIVADDIVADDIVEDVESPEDDSVEEPSPPVAVVEQTRAPIVIGRSRRRDGSLIAVASGWALLIGFVAGVLSLAYTKRVEVVRLLPGAAKAYARLGIPVNVRGLQFENVQYSWSVDAGRPTLEVHGDIVNVTRQPIKVPTVVFALRNGVDTEVYQWAADVREEPLPARDRTRFVARIPTPPKSIRSVQVRFAKFR
ncbi:MAG: zinc-ribbon domain-containing protein [Methyloligellaceae bacterium]